MSTADFAEVPDRTNPVGLLPWLVLTAGPTSDVATGRTHPAWLAVSGLVAFAALYAATIWCRLRLGRPRTAYALAAVLAGVTIAMSLGFGVTMTSTLFPLLALASGAVLPWRRLAFGPPLPIAVALLTAGAAALITWVKHGSGSASGRPATAPCWPG